MLHQDLVSLTETGQPQFINLDFINQHGMQRDYNVLRQPLSEDGETVPMLFAFADYGMATLAPS